jgi:alkanesulfonate monooxygenase SsuD/methylene tetrahydromethanopterin reductase-like flavin-dependent oxidoreductase (luciferase family)
MKWKIRFIEEGALEAGRDPAEIDVWVRSILIVAESMEAAFREVASFLPGSLQIGNYIKFRNIGYREEVDRILKELDREQPGIGDEILATLKVFDHFAFERLDNPACKVATQKVVDFFNQTGTEDDVCEVIERLGEAGVKCLATATYTIIDRKAHIEEVGKRIIPQFRG